MATVKIEISGQINGNSTLRNALCGFVKAEKGMFNGFILTFNSKKEAIVSIRNAFNFLVSEEPELKNRLGGMRVKKSRTELYYDASKAVIN